MAITELSREEAEALYDRRLRGMHPDKVLQERIAEIEKQDKAEAISRAVKKQVPRRA